MVDWGVVCLLAATVGPIVRQRGLWAATACAAILQSLPVSCYFRGCKVPLFRTVSGAISSELALPLPLPLIYYNILAFVIFFFSSLCRLESQFDESSTQPATGTSSFVILRPVVAAVKCHLLCDMSCYYAALLPRRGPHIASHSVCPSVPLSSVTRRHLANYNDTHVLFSTH